jgi:hypothetical protein
MHSLTRSSPLKLSWYSIDLMRTDLTSGLFPTRVVL